MKQSEIVKVKDALLAKLCDLACRHRVLLRNIRIRRILLRLQAVEKLLK